ncbi:MAG: tRNA guanosine(34) transglycosylase Tgt [Myxococcota bacterium]
MDPLSEAGPPRFETLAHDGAARCGRLRTPHGTIETPAFLPVGTYGAVRGIAPGELREIGVQGILTNTYHLHLRPGEEAIARLGGLHGFMAWPGPLATDSGGFQVYSLDHLCRRSEQGVEFRSPIDGSRHQLTPETCIGIQETLGADLIVTLDEFEPIPREAFGAAEAQTREMMERTLRWAERCRDARTRQDQLLFGIVQGGGTSELRAESAERTAALGFEAFAIGGLGLGESSAQRNELVEVTVARLPRECPRYVMGLGQPDDLIEAVCRGADLFDCVVPTRDGRHGSVFTREGRINLRNARFRDDAGPIDPECTCPSCTGYSRAYLRHLLRSGEALASRLLSLHNLAFYMTLMRELRDAIQDHGLQGWLEEWRGRYVSAAAHNAA